MILDATTQTLELETSAAVSTDYVVSWADHTSSAFTPGSSQGNISTATTTTILAAPGASTQRQVKTISVRNRSTTSSQTVVLKKDVSGTEYHLTGSYTLSAGDCLQIDGDMNVKLLDRNGRAKTITEDTSGYGGRAFEYYKIGTASEAVGVRYGFAKDSGLPGAWVPGAPGLNGWWTDASAATNAANPAGATQVGCPQMQNPATGGLYLTDIGLTTSVAHLVQLNDLLWYNTGIAVTTTTAQAIAQPGTSIPARDAYGSTNGEGWGAAIYVTTATTNAGAVTNTTLSYTNSDGTAGRTATIASFPATAVAGTWVPFQLAAGDRGIRSIQSITLGTSYGGGAISLCMYRALAFVPNPVVNVGGIMAKTLPTNPGVRLYNGTALWWTYVSSATTATTFSGQVSIMER